MRGARNVPGHSQVHKPCRDLFRSAAASGTCHLSDPACKHSFAGGTKQLAQCDPNWAYREPTGSLSENIIMKNPETLKSM